MTAATTEHFPNATVVAARDLYVDTSDWRARWPKERRSYKALVFFDDGTSWIGRGVYAEAKDICSFKRPIYWLADDQNAAAPELLKGTQFAIRALSRGFRQYASVQRRPARPLDYPFPAPQNPFQTDLAATYSTEEINLDIAKLCELIRCREIELERLLAQETKRGLQADFYGRKLRPASFALARLWCSEILANWTPEKFPTSRSLALAVLWGETQAKFRDGHHAA